MVITEERKNKYIEKVYRELNNRGVSYEEIPLVINKTGFLKVMEEYPEEQLHYSVKNTVDEILLTAALAQK